ncbi:DNA cytosine methyltransferase [Xenorhabdus bovienii]|uniref:DNA cytosine methyltransferase n=1 Tax=Xenorhabdus bovienii TaxID=40576 RepID=UPI0004D6B34A|nr:DNA cytosine methyltransferase [Xenorhabdus bovienii]CDG88139.1 Phage methyltransferase [Xenorhabdus bovienii str. feltiae France]CDG93196.1 Phage methyltransferase [Xenorhabdus bovienii str. feltiae Florida]
MAGAYYNEIDPYAAQWLRNLIIAGHIAPGDVDERSIEDVSPGDLRGYKQCHFFAGIGVWSYTLRNAGWSDNKPVWTGSCPCQPFSAAGKGNGFDDERHLWPHFHYLIEQCRPRVVFGEQVASKDGLAWLDLVQTDLAGTGYSSAAIDICAAGVGAPHIRQRLYWVANANSERASGQWFSGYTERRQKPDVQQAGLCNGTGNIDELAYADNRHDTAGNPLRAGWPASINGGEPFGLVDWRDADWLFCRDGKWRPVEPGTFPLAHGITNRVGRLRAYGNAIVAPVAETFIRAYIESEKS